MIVEWQVEQLIAKAKRYAAAKGITISTASTHIFNDGKVLPRLINGASITTRRFNAAMDHLDRHQPGGGSRLSTLGGDRRGGHRARQDTIGVFRNG